MFDLYKSYLWLWRIIIAFLLIIVFINKTAVIDRYNPSSWWGILAVTVISWITAELILKRINLSTSGKYLLILLSGLAVYADVFGTVFHLYNIYNHYDWFIHFFVPAIIAIWIWHLLKTMIKLPSKWHIWLVITSTAFVGNLFEFAEYAADTLWVHGHYWIAGGPDTVEDILFNALGAVTTVTIIKWIEIKKNFTEHS